MTPERRVLVMALRALLRRDTPDPIKGYNDHDVEAVIAAASDLGVDGGED